MSQTYTSKYLLHFLFLVVFTLLFWFPNATEANSIDTNCYLTLTSPDPDVVGNYYLYSYKGSNPTTTDYTTYNAILTSYINTSDGVPVSWDLDTYISYIGDMYFIKWSADLTQYQGIWGYTTRNGTDNCTGTEVDVVTPTQITSFTYSTTTGQARVKGWWNATTTSGIYEQLEFYQQSTLFGIQDLQTETATTTGLFDLSFYYYSIGTTTTATTTPIFNVNRVLYAKIYQYDNNYFSDPFSGIVDPLYKTLLVSTSTQISDFAYNISSTTSIFAYPEYECGISSITGCIKNALIWAFFPSEDSFVQHREFLDLVQTKSPVGYFSGIRNNINELSATSTSAFTVTIPTNIKESIIDPVDTAIASILWFVFLLAFYKRFKNIQL